MKSESKYPSCYYQFNCPPYTVYMERNMVKHKMILPVYDKERSTIGHIQDNIRTPAR